MNRPTTLSALFAPRRTETRRRAGARPPGRSIERLERRELMAYTDVAQLFAANPRHGGPTMLYLNFDGGTLPASSHGPGAAYSIRPFEIESGDTSLNRDRDIQDILLQVSEVFAPFDVEVRRLVGQN